MHRKLLALAATASAFSFVPSASAATIIINPSAPAGTFENPNAVCTGNPCTFSDSGTFTAPAGFNRVGATVTSGPSTVGSSTDIDFLTGFLNGTAFTFNTTGAIDTGFVLPIALLDGLNTLSFTGRGFGANSSGSYSGTLTFSNVAGVPEPATWAMMLLGFGMLGYALRRRSKVQTRVNFAMG